MLIKYETWNTNIRTNTKDFQFHEMLIVWYCNYVYSLLEKRLVIPVLPLSDLEWKIIYVGSAESEEYDQVLDSVLVGPVPAGRHMFVFQVGYDLGNTCSWSGAVWSTSCKYEF